MLSHPDYRELTNPLRQTKNAFLVFVVVFFLLKNISYYNKSNLRHLQCFGNFYSSTSFLYSYVIYEVMWGNVTVAKPSVWVEDERLTGKVVVVCSIQIAVVKTI